MKIALVAPFEEPVPPVKYGGTELVVGLLANELHKRGHDVTLFASGDSNVPCRLVSVFSSGIRTTPPYDTNAKMREAAKYKGIAKVLDIINKEHFDMVHNHIGWRYLLFEPFVQSKTVTTLHGPMSLPYQYEGFQARSDYRFVSISNNQRKDLPTLHYIDTVYNGINIDPYTFTNDPEDYLLFLGRMSPEKGVKQAIEIARSSGKKLKIATKVDTVDLGYFEEVKKCMEGANVEMVGEIGMDEKVTLLKNAIGLLAPIQWEEPFGLNVVEAMACGTPVLGVARGSFPELITHGVDGFLAKTAEDLTPFVSQLGHIDRHMCRQTVEKRFTKEVMVDGYLEVYKKIAAGT